jgi:two-component sensor histidine kinase
MALAHEKLYASRDLQRIDLREYAESVTASLLLGEEAAGAVEIRTDIEDLILPVDLAIPCGLLINELLSNAIAHGFPDGAAGQIELRCRRTNGDYVLEVRDTGVGIPADVDAHKPRSLGLQLVSMLVEQLHGTLQVETGEGTRISVTFPAQSEVDQERQP